MTDPMREPAFPGERLITQFSREQRGWMAMALVAFLGVVFVGPAYTRATVSGRRIARRTRARARQLGGGTIRKRFRFNG